MSTLTSILGGVSTRARAYPRILPGRKSLTHASMSGRKYVSRKHRRHRGRPKRTVYRVPFHPGHWDTPPRSWRGRVVYAPRR